MNILQEIAFVQSAQSILLTVQSKGRLIKEIIKYWLYFIKLSALFLLSLDLSLSQIFNMVSLPMSLAQTWLLFSLAALSTRIEQGRSYDLITEPTFTF